MAIDTFSFAAQRALFMSLIRPIRDADSDQGRDLIRRVMSRMEYQADQTRTRINTLTDTDNFSKLRSDLVTFLRYHVGFTSELDNIVSRLSTATLTKLCTGAVQMWVRRGSPSSMKDMIRLLTGRNATYLDWFYFRALLADVPANSNHQMDGNTLALWRLDDAFSVWPRDISPNALHMTGVMGSFFPSPAAGLIGDGGASTYLIHLGTVLGWDTFDIPASVLLGECTVEAWIKLDPVYFPSFTGPWNTIFAHGGGENAGVNGACTIHTSVTNTGKLRVEWHGSGMPVGGVGAFTDTSGTILTAGVVYHVAFVRRFINNGTASQVSLYLNGALLSTSGALGNPNQAGLLFMTIGGDISNNPVCGFYGWLDDMRVSACARTATEIWTSYQRGVAGTTPALDDGDIPGGDLWIIGGDTLQDELTSHLRAMDPGGTDAQLMLDVVNLCRPLSERVEVSLLDFWDPTDDGTTKMLATTAVAVLPQAKSLLLPHNCVAAPNITILPTFTQSPGSADFSEYIVSMDVNFNAFAQHFRLTGLNSLPNAKMSADVWSNASASVVGKVTVNGFGLGGLGTGILATPTYDIQPGEWHTLRMYFKTYPALNYVYTGVLFDGNSVMDQAIPFNFAGIGDTAPAGGGWYVWDVDAAGANGIEIKNISSHRMPMRSAIVSPTGYSYSNNFLTG